MADDIIELLKGVGVVTAVALSLYNMLRPSLQFKAKLEELEYKMQALQKAEENHRGLFSPRWFANAESSWARIEERLRNIEEKVSRLEQWLSQIETRLQ